TTIEFTKLECVNKWPEILQIKCHINRTSKNISAVYGELIFSEEIKNMNGNYLLGVEYNNKFINYTSVDLDYCAALQMVHSQSLIQLVFVGMRRVSNFPLNCPLKKNQLYYINGFTINTDIIPSYFPTITFVADATYVTNRR
ncbi:hypothetical protein KR044_002956, partial [Drosophila immigrans]